MRQLCRMSIRMSLTRQLGILRPLILLEKQATSIMANSEFRMTNCGHSLISNEEPYFKLGISVSNLKIISFNMHGYRQGFTFLDSLLNNSDVDVVSSKSIGFQIISC